jgi:MFS family permease
MSRPIGSLEAQRHGVARLIPAAGFGACPAHPDLPAAPRPPGETAEGARRCQRWTLAVVCLASALLLFNVTAPNVALPAIAADLSAGFSAQQWVLSAYAMVLASLLLAGGALGDRYGRRRLFLLGLAGFGVGSLLCTLAPTTGLLIAGRLIQGAGAAALFPAGLALIAAEFDGPGRARAIGVWGASVSGAIALGCSAGSSWRSSGGGRSSPWPLRWCSPPPPWVSGTSGRAATAPRPGWTGREPRSSPVPWCC